ncbi:MAG: hypothetical protein MUO31_13100 [Thermodesulfovibrionales bacterium]|nr:hypothetical protein [Thermodesulfovibrionales bacterium]
MKRRDLLKLAIAAVVAPSASKDKPEALKKLSVVTHGKQSNMYSLSPGKVVFDSKGYVTIGIG